MSMHVIIRTHATQPIQHTHQGKDKKQVQLELSMYLKVDVHDHQPTLEDQHQHYASMCLQFSHTQEDHVHVSRRVG